MFYTFPDALHWYPSWTWQIARLPEILPGYVLTAIFHSITADYLLFLFYYLVSLAFFYQAVRLLVSREVGAFATIFLATNPLVIANYSVTLDGPALVWELASLFFVAHAITATSKRKSNIFMLASGVTAGLAINSYLNVAVFVVTNFLIYIIAELLCRNESIGRRVLQVAFSLLLAAAGTALSFAALGAVIVAFHGHFDQIFNQLVYAQNMIHQVAMGKGGLGESQRPNWYKTGPIAGMLLAAGLIAAFNVSTTIRGGIASARSESAIKLVAISAATLVLIALLLASVELGSPIVGYDFLYVNFVPYMAIIMFSMLANATIERLSAGYRVITAFFVCAMLLLFLHDGAIPWLYEAPGQTYVALACAMLSALTLIVLLRRPRSAPLYLYLAIVVILGGAMRGEIGAQIWQDDRVSAQMEQDSYVRIRQGLEFLSRVRFDAVPNFWLDESIGPELIAIPRSYLQCVSYDTFPPSIDPKQARFMLPGRDVVIVASRESLSTRASEVLSSLHLRADERATWSVAYRNLKYQILVDHITGTTNRPAISSWPPPITAPVDGEVLVNAFDPASGPGAPAPSQQRFPFKIDTPPQPWAYGALFPFRITAVKGPLWVKIQLKVLKGPVGVGILNEAQTAALDMKTLRPFGGSVTITLRVRDPVKPGAVVIQSWNGSSGGQVEIQQMSIILPRGT
jgi:hypothetical protein